MLPSEKNFGLVFSGLFLLLFGYFYFKGFLFLPLLILGLIFLILTFFAPNVLKPLNVIWFRFGEMLGAIVSPIIMALIYFSVFLISNLALRMAGKLLLNKSFDKNAKTYWEPRKKQPESMKRQF